MSDLVLISVFRQVKLHPTAISTGSRMMWQAEESDVYTVGIYVSIKEEKSFLVWSENCHAARVT